MKNYPIWKSFTVVSLVLLGIIFAIPSIIYDENSENWFLKNKINLGLDLQGGSYLLLEVQLDVLYKEELDNFVDSVRLISRDQAVKIEKIDIQENDPKIKKLLDAVKDREFIGYSYDGADASFELLARRIIGEIPRYISINEYDVSVKKNKSGEIVSSAKAQLEVDGEKIMCEGEGNGPVNALDNAIRQNVERLAKYSKYLKDLKLVDYKLRILNTISLIKILQRLNT